MAYHDVCLDLLHTKKYYYKNLIKKKHNTKQCNQTVCTVQLKCVKFTESTEYLKFLHVDGTPNCQKRSTTITNQSTLKTQYLLYIWLRSKQNGHYMYVYISKSKARKLLSTAWTLFIWLRFHQNWTTFCLNTLYTIYTKVFLLGTHIANTSRIWTVLISDVHSAQPALSSVFIYSPSFHHSHILIADLIEYNVWLQTAHGWAFIFTADIFVFIWTFSAFNADCAFNMLLKTH